MPIRDRDGERIARLETIPDDIKELKEMMSEREKGQLLIMKELGNLGGKIDATLDYQKLSEAKFLAHENRISSTEGHIRDTQVANRTASRILNWMMLAVTGLIAWVIDIFIQLKHP